MRSEMAVCLVAVLMMAQGGARAESGSEGSKGIAIEKVAAKTDQRLKVKSSAFEEGKWIPEKFSEYGQGISPPLVWSKAPDGTRSFVVIVDDPDAPRATPFVHWVLYDLPADRTSLPMDLPRERRLESLGGAKQGTNSAGRVGYFGPRPPKGDPAHHYHFQVFALDQKLDVDAGARQGELLDAMKGHVLADGQTVGIFRAP